MRRRRRRRRCVKAEIGFFRRVQTCTRRSVPAKFEQAECGGGVCAGEVETLQLPFRRVDKTRHAETLCKKRGHADEIKCSSRLRCRSKNNNRFLFPAPPRNFHSHTRRLRRTLACTYLRSAKEREGGGGGEEGCSLRCPEENWGEAVNPPSLPPSSSGPGTRARQRG